MKLGNFSIIPPHSQYATHTSVYHQRKCAMFHVINIVDCHKYNKYELENIYKTTKQEETMHGQESAFLLKWDENQPT